MDTTQFKLMQLTERDDGENYYVPYFKDDRLFDTVTELIQALGSTQLHNERKYQVKMVSTTVTETVI